MPSLKGVEPQINVFVNAWAGPDCQKPESAEVQGSFSFRQQLFMAPPVAPTSAFCQENT
jgi:hypothetical protein